MFFVTRACTKADRPLAIKSFAVDSEVVIHSTYMGVCGPQPSSGSGPRASAIGKGTRELTKAQQFSAVASAIANARSCVPNIASRSPRVCGHRPPAAVTSQPRNLATVACATAAAASKSDSLSLTATPPGHAAHHAR